jgi:hypothetical protein
VFSISECCDAGVVQIERDTFAGNLEWTSSDVT